MDVFVLVKATVSFWEILLLMLPIKKLTVCKPIVPNRVKKIQLLINMSATQVSLLKT
jgi:hypothetical protein